MPLAFKCKNAYKVTNICVAVGAGIYVLCGIIVFYVITEYDITAKMVKIINNNLKKLRDILAMLSPLIIAATLCSSFKLSCRICERRES